MVTLYLCSVPFLDSSSNISIDFRDKESQINYFRGKNTDIIPNVNLQADAELTYVTVKKTISDLMYCDYLFYLGDDNRYYYYFVTNKKFKNQSSSILELELDVLQTYMFDWYWMDTFVDRCHVDRWKRDGTPTDNLEDEGVQPTSMIKSEVKMLRKMSNNIIYVTSEPIEHVSSTGGGEGGGETGGGPTSGNWQEGVPSKELFRFLKGFEGLGQYLYKDSGGVPTIGYGVTGSEPSHFNDLKASQPVSETKAAQVMWSTLVANYGKKIVKAVKGLGCTKQSQFDALCSLAYNGGIDLVINSSGDRELANTIKKNPNDENAIRAVWERYYTSDGTQQQPGLVARRKQECNMYFGKSYEVRPISIIGQNGLPNGKYVTENNGNGWLPD